MATRSVDTLNQDLILEEIVKSIEENKIDLAEIDERKAISTADLVRTILQLQGVMAIANVIGEEQIHEDERCLINDIREGVNRSQAMANDLLRKRAVIAPDPALDDFLKEYQETMDWAEYMLSQFSPAIGVQFDDAWEGSEARIGTMGPCEESKAG
jgi:hypothetical protein